MWHPHGASGVFTLVFLFELDVLALDEYYEKPQQQEDDDRSWRKSLLPQVPQQLDQHVAVVESQYSDIGSAGQYIAFAVGS